MLQEFALAFIGIFVALDIIGTLPLYVGMTRAMKPTERKQVVNVSMWVALAVALVFLVLGEKIFAYLGITLFDFKIAGGLVLLLISLADLLGQPESAHRASGSTGVVPLAVPLITGPGVLTTLILQVKTLGYPITIAALLVNYLLAWGLLRRSESITRLIGKDGTVVISKIAALLLAAIAVSMMRGGIFEALHAFKSG
ncbi:MAG: MarC family protein [Oligoflexia bacterium]|nr:MarC family protein [Oligoflexia bacterium]